MKDDIGISKVSKACSCFPKQSLNSTMLLGNILPDLYPVPSMIYRNYSLAHFKLPPFVLTTITHSVNCSSYN